MAFGTVFIFAYTIIYFNLLKFIFNSLKFVQHKTNWNICCYCFYCRKINKDFSFLFILSILPISFSYSKCLWWRFILQKQKRKKKGNIYDKKTKFLISFVFCSVLFEICCGVVWCGNQVEEFFCGVCLSVAFW